jgi:hypothetical protein
MSLEGHPVKNLILALMAATSLAAALPAAAQDAPYNPFRGREAADAQRIAWCVNTGAMSTREAGRLYTELREIARLGERLGYDGVSPRERFLIGLRLRQLEREIAMHCLRVHRPYYEQEYNRFPHPDPGPYRGHDRYDGYERGGHRPSYDGRFNGGPHDGRGQREILRLR